MKPNVIFVLIYFIIIIIDISSAKKKSDRTKCPKVNPYRHFNFDQILGQWYVVEYYASSEESVIYSCMKTLFRISSNDIEISMNFTYNFVDDPDNELLFGNITWRVPDLTTPAHWVHAEGSYEGVYNTYVLDINIEGEKSWVLLLHCAEKNSSTRYLSSFIMGKQPALPNNVRSYLQHKLPQYGIDLQYLFGMNQKNCENQTKPSYYSTIQKTIKFEKHPLNHNHPDIS